MYLPTRPRRIALQTLLGLLFILVFSVYSPPGIYDQLINPVSDGSMRVSGFLAASGIWLLSLGVLMYAALSRPLIKWLVFTLVTVSFVGMATYRQAVGKVMEYADGLTLWQARGNAQDAVQEYALAVIPALPWMAVLLCGFLLVRGFRRRATSITILLFCLSVGAFVGVCVIKRGGATDKLPQITGLYGLIAAQMLDTSEHQYVYATEDLPDHSAKAMNVILVIDESIRHDFFQRMVLPEISGKQGDWRVHDFGLATSMANCSAPSNIMLRKGVRSGSVARDLYDRPLIWSYAQNAGFKTSLMNGQRFGRAANFFDETEWDMIDVIPDPKEWMNDAEILDSMPFLNDGAHTFSIVIKQGAHFPYGNNYPSTYESSSAVAHTTYVAASPKRLEYVNALDYQTGGFFAKLMGMHIQTPTMVVYTSDHGQNVDDRPGTTHCSASLLPSADEGVVPLVILTNYASSELEQAAAVGRNRMSHFNIAPIILDVMGYDTSRWHPASSLVEAALQPSMPGYVYGSPFGYFGSDVTVMDVDRAGYERMVEERWRD